LFTGAETPRRKKIKMQTLKQAIYLAQSGKSRSLVSAAKSLDGCPVGGWPQTEQVRRELRNELPVRSLRSYTADEFISALYTVDSSDRYRSTVGAHV
jgi:hypothetical protein